MSSEKLMMPDDLETFTHTCSDLEGGKSKELETPAETTGHDTVAYGAEFMGTMMFQLVGGGSSAGPYNGLVLMVIIFCTANYSGGHVNPAVTLGLMVGGEHPLAKGFIYILVQLLGAFMGALITAEIFAYPGTSTAIFDYAGNKDGVSPIHMLATGCAAPTIVQPQGDMKSSEPLVVSNGQVFGAEYFGTLLLVATVFGAAVSKKGFGHMAPIAIGLSIFAAVESFGSISGGAFNPARFLGPAAVWGCGVDNIWLYCTAECAAGITAGLLWRFVQKPHVDAQCDAEAEAEAKREAATKAHPGWGSRSRPLSCSLSSSNSALRASLLR